MSTVYYIINKKKLDDYENLCKFLKNEAEKVKNDFIEFGKKFEDENIENIVDYDISSFFDSLKYKMEPDEIRFGQFTSRGFTFFNDFTCFGIRDVDTLRNFMNLNPDYIIEDECGEKFTIEQFIEEIVNRE